MPRLTVKSDLQKSEREKSYRIYPAILGLDPGHFGGYGIETGKDPTDEKMFFRRN